jgi:spermatogenesis-associated protein 4
MSSTLPRAMLKWMQSLDLSYSVKSVRRDFANGFLVAEIFNRYFKNEIEMHSFDNGASMARRKDNWEQLEKFFAKMKFPITRQEIDGVMHCHADAVIPFMKKVYTVLTSKPINSAPPLPLDESIPAFARPTASLLVRQKLNDSAMQEHADMTQLLDEAQSIVKLHQEKMKLTRAFDRKTRFSTPASPTNRVSGSTDKFSSTNSVVSPLVSPSNRKRVRRQVIKKQQPQSQPQVQQPQIQTSDAIVEEDPEPAPILDPAPVPTSAQVQPETQPQTAPVVAAAAVERKPLPQGPAAIPIATRRIAIETAELLSSLGVAHPHSRAVAGTLYSTLALDSQAREKLLFGGENKDSKKLLDIVSPNVLIGTITNHLHNISPLAVDTCYVDLLLACVRDPRFEAVNPELLIDPEQAELGTWVQVWTFAVQRMRDLLLAELCEETNAKKVASVFRRLCVHPFLGPSTAQYLLTASTTPDNQSVAPALFGVLKVVYANPNERKESQSVIDDMLTKLAVTLPGQFITNIYELLKNFSEFETAKFNNSSVLPSLLARLSSSD